MELLKGSPCWKALVVTSTPSRPTFQESVITIVRPVMVQMIRVSIMVPIMEIRPCVAGESFCAAAAAIGALPIPASLEKIPLAIPFCIAMITAPKAPPATARIPNALCTMVTIAAGMAVTLKISTNRQATT